MSSFREAFAAIAVLCSLWSCGGSASKAPVPVGNVDPWVLECDDARATDPAYLANGLVGLRIGRDGSGDPGFPMLDIARYDAAEDIVRLPNPLVGALQVGARVLSPLSSVDYKQRMDMRTGLLSTEWTEGRVRIEVLCILHPDRRLFARRVILVAPPGTSLSVANRVDSSRLRTSSSGVAGTRVSSSGGAVVFQGTAEAGQSAQFDQVFTLGQDSGRQETFDEIRRDAETAWKNRWKTDVIIDGPDEDQRAIRSWLFYLRSSLREGQEIVSPMGLSSDLYKGHVFWDADTWIFPALSLIDPAVAKAIPGYRERMLLAASRRFKELPGDSTGAQYPWESALSGRELAPKSVQKQDHITGDVALMARQASALGLLDERGAGEIEDGAREYFGKIASGVAGAPLEIKGVMGPDEYHVGDNDLYTNSLAQLLQGEARHFKLPRDRTSLVTYDGDPVRNYQQADALLAIYPAQNPVAEKEARIMMSRFPPKTNEAGPAMTHSIQALIWARLGETEAAYGEWEKSWKEYSDRPLSLFGERRGAGRTYFLTGAAGCLQAVLYGFTGFRIDWKKDPNALWAKGLSGGSWLTLTPHLPKQWKQVTLRNFSVLGQHYTFKITHNGIKVSQGES